MLFDKHLCILIYLYFIQILIIQVSISSSLSSTHAISMKYLESLSLLTNGSSREGTQLMNSIFCRTNITGVSMWRNLLENVAYELVQTSPAGFRMSYLDDLCDGRLVAKQLLFYATDRICLKQHTLFLWSSHLAFSFSVSLVSMLYIHTILLTLPHLERNLQSKWRNYRVVLTQLRRIPVLFYHRDYISMVFNQSIEVHAFLMHITTLHYN